MSIPRVFYGLNRKEFLPPKRLWATMISERHICAGKCRKQAKNCRKQRKLIKNRPKPDLNCPSSQQMIAYTKLACWGENQINFHQRLWPEIGKNWPKIAGNEQNRSKSSRTKLYKPYYGWERKHSHNRVSGDGDISALKKKLSQKLPEMGQKMMEIGQKVPKMGLISL